MWDVYQKRVRVEVNYDFRPSEHGGNTITLYNPSSVPILIRYWTVLRIKRLPPVAHPIIDRNDVDGGDIQLNGHSAFSLVFDEENYFSTHIDETRKHGKLYIDLQIVGRRKPLLVRVYP